MKWMLSLLIFVIMEKNLTFAQAYLKNGVYEFIANTSSDSLGNGRFPNIEKRTVSRILTVAGADIRYRIREHTQIPAASYGLNADYYLKLQRVNNSYSAKNKIVHLNLVIIDKETVQIQILMAKANYLYSGGRYFKQVINLPPETKTLIYKGN